MQKARLSSTLLICTGYPPSSSKRPCSGSRTGFYINMHIKTPTETAMLTAVQLLHKNGPPRSRMPAR